MEAIIAKKTEFQLYCERTPATEGPSAAPIDPIPFVSAEIVAIAARDGTLQPKSAETVEIIIVKGPLISPPIIISKVCRKNSKPIEDSE